MVLEDLPDRERAMCSRPTQPAGTEAYLRIEFVLARAGYIASRRTVYELRR